MIAAIMEVSRAVRRAKDHNHFSYRVVRLVTLDVRNAFYSAIWNDILEALTQTFRIHGYLLRIIDDYLKALSLIYTSSEGKREIAVTSKAAQDSILGSDISNVAYDSVLRVGLPDEVCLIGYTDDVTILIATCKCLISRRSSLIE